MGASPTGPATPRWPAAGAAARWRHGSRPVRACRSRRPGGGDAGGPRRRVRGTAPVRRARGAGAVRRARRRDLRPVASSHVTTGARAGPARAPRRGRGARAPTSAALEAGDAQPQHDRAVGRRAPHTACVPHLLDHPGASMASTHTRTSSSSPSTARARARRAPPPRRRSPRATRRCPAAPPPTDPSIRSTRNVRPAPRSASQPTRYQWPSRKPEAAGGHPARLAPVGEGHLGPRAAPPRRGAPGRPAGRTTATGRASARPVAPNFEGVPATRIAQVHAGHGEVEGGLLVGRQRQVRQVEGVRVDPVPELLGPLHRLGGHRDALVAQQPLVALEGLAPGVVVGRVARDLVGDGVEGQRALGVAAAPAPGR